MNTDDIKKYRAILTENMQVVDEAHYGSLLRPPSRRQPMLFASAILYNDYDSEPRIEYFDSLEAAISNGSETSAHHNSAYAWNGKRWVKKYGATEPASSGSKYGETYLFRESGN